MRGSEGKRDRSDTPPCARSPVGLTLGVPVLLGMVLACGHVATSPAALPPLPDVRASGGASLGPPQYLVADPSARGGHRVALPVGSGVGLAIDKTRIVIGRGEPRLGEDLPELPILGAAPIPTRLGAGFLFWTNQTLYHASAFEGRLEPIAQLPNSIEVISFAPRSLLVRTQNGERWALGLPSGERMAIEPLGAVDVEGLDDGRALAFDDQGAAYASTDGGAHWNDVTASLKSSPTRVAVVEGEIWLFEASGGALRLEPSGQISSFDKQPIEKPVELRVRDPRWRGADAPLRTAFRSGASVDESTAILVEQGDVVRLDVHSGEIVSVVAGKLPPDARCEAVPTPNDVLFACLTRAGGPGGNAQATAFVVSHTLSDGGPLLEQTFSAAGQFYASDDGGLAFAGPCAGSTAVAQAQAACVRQPGGSWQDVDASALSADAGGSDIRVARWVPRADGSAVALVLEPAPGIFDPRRGSLTPVATEVRDVLAQGPEHGRFSRRSGGGVFGRNEEIVDGSWSFSARGSLRGWQRQGAIVELSEDGSLSRSPYEPDLELETAGAFGLGRTREGRLYQSTDHGATWIEVAAPPSGGTSVEQRSCSSAGCDLGGFYRVGWAATPPRPPNPTRPARPAPEVRRTPPAALTCRPSGPSTAKVLTRTSDSPEDLGLGHQRLPVAGERGGVGFLRVAIPRGIVHPLHEPDGGDSDLPSLRGVLSGFGTSRDGDVIEVTGPNKSARALRRAFSFVPGLDPAAPVKRAVIAMSDVLGVGRAAGMTDDDILGEDMTESGTVIVVTPHDPLAAAELALHNPHGLLALVRPNERVKLAMRPPRNESTVISGVALGGDEAAFLELEAGGVGHVFKITSAGTIDLFDVNANASDGSFYPANPDALAVGPRGELAVVRTGSGSDPASRTDPALLLVPAMPAVALAPWSTLRLADDPSCKEPGWRTTLQVIAPWLHVGNPELKVEGLPMLARVKWSEKHVCLEGFEVRGPDVSVRVPAVGVTDLQRVGSWVVGRGSSFSRVAIAEGVEWRQPLECVLTKKP